MTTPGEPGVFAFLLSLAFLFPAPGRSGSEIDEYDIEIWQVGDTLFTSTRLVAHADDAAGLAELRRVTVPFDPEHQMVDLLSARRRAAGGDWIDLPDWSVDTLFSGASGRLELVVVYPGLLPGGGIEHHVVMADWSGLWTEGPWFLLDPSGMPPIARFDLDLTASADEATVLWASSGTAYEEKGGSAPEEGRLLLEAAYPEDLLEVTCITSWEELTQLLFADATGDPVEESIPPDLREAALEIAAGGLSTTSDLAKRACFAVSDNFRLIASPPLQRVFEVRDLQEILDSRIASSLEMAVLLQAILRERGISGRLIACRQEESLLPTPAGWNRFLVSVSTEHGTDLLLEPSAYRSPSGYVHRPDGLWGLEASGSEPRFLAPNTPAENFCMEEYRVRPSEGIILLRVRPRGYYSMVIRGMLAGLSAQEVLLELARWFWRSGSLLSPDSVVATNLLDLTEPAELYAAVALAGRVEESDAPSSAYLHLPCLDWGAGADIPPSDFHRTWYVHWNGGLSSEEGVTVSRDDEESIWILEGPDSTVACGGILVRLEQGAD